MINITLFNKKYHTFYYFDILPKHFLVPGRVFLNFVCYLSVNNEVGQTFIFK